MEQNNIIQQYLPQIQSLMRKYGVEKAYAFGSAVKGKLHKGSDLDFIIRFPDVLDCITYSDNYFALADSLENLLKREGDLVAEKTLSNPYFIKSIDSHKIQVI